jgi:hypothetical protein
MKYDQTVVRCQDFRPSDRKWRTSKILYRNEQWAVTNYGIESLPETTPYNCDIPKNRLAAMRGPHSMWVLHMMETKCWADYALFADALEKALAIHGIKAKFDVEASHKEADRRRRKSAESREEDLVDLRQLA